jgi:hypothetical protein
LHYGRALAQAAILSVVKVSPQRIERLFSREARSHEAAVVVPPRKDSVPSGTAGTAPTQRDRHLRLIAERGRMGWQKVARPTVR